MTTEIIDNQLKKILIQITNLPNDKSLYVLKYEKWGFVEFSLRRSFWNRTENSLCIVMNAIVRITAVENLWDDMIDKLGWDIDDLEVNCYKNERIKTLDGISTFVFGPNSYLNDIEREKYGCYELSDIGFEKIKNDFASIYHDKLLPELKKSLDIKFLDETVNDKVEYLGGDASVNFLNPQGLLLRRMILAKLSGNILYENICDFNKSIVEKMKMIAIGNQNKYHKNFPVVFEELYKRLRNVEPLKDTKLYLSLY